MAEIKTQATDADVAAFLVGSPRADDARALAEMMAEVSGEPPTLWGPSIVGFGQYRYRHESGRTGEMCRIGFSPRKAALTLYLSADFPTRDALLARLGKHKTGKGCVYVKALADVDRNALRELIAASLASNRASYPEGSA